MVFSSSVFLFLFLPFVLICYYHLHRRYRNLFLLLASLFFYAWGEPKFVYVMIASSVLNYLCALAIEKTRNKKIVCRSILIIAVIMNTGILFVFKYMNFISANLHRVFSSVKITSIALPIGISFFTFQAISYIVDVYRKEEAQKNPINIALYISLFPQLIAGPIVRYNTVAKEIKTRQETWEMFAAGSVRFLQGLSKKMILANNLALIADSAFAMPSADRTVVYAWVGMLAYTLQIFFDFSGYSDMAIGLGKMFGFHFNENFNYPYLSSSITDFWRRWHISLGTWFRDYVYIPLGGSRTGSRWKHIRNLFAVWMLTGLWHGASWNFIFWGFMYFLSLTAEKYLIHPDRFSMKPVRIAYRIVTMIAVMFGWVLFRANGLHEAGHYFMSMFGMCGNALTNHQTNGEVLEYAGMIILSVICCSPVLKKASEYLQKCRFRKAFAVVRFIGYAFLFIGCISYLVMETHNPFIYFNF